MRQPDLTPLMQVLLLGSALALTAAVVVRFSLYVRNQYAGLTYRYPTTWTAEQANMFGRLRLAIGGCLAMTWLTLLLAAPRLPVSWPFGFEGMLLTIGLIAADQRLALVRLNWENSLLSKYRFRSGFAVVALWWMGVFALILSAIGWAMTAHLHLVFPYDTIA